MVTGRSQSSITYLPEKINNPDARSMKGESKDTDHMANWFECIRDRKQPNASVDIGYKSRLPRTCRISLSSESGALRWTRRWRRRWMRICRAAGEERVI